MDYSSIRIVGLMKTKMAWHAENQDVLAHNVANSDTPGFKAKKLKELDFKRLALIEANKLKMRMTSPVHLKGNKPIRDFRMEEQRKTFEETPVENAIALEEQMARVAANNHEYMLTTNMYRKTAEMFKTAIGQR